MPTTPTSDPAPTSSTSTTRRDVVVALALLAIAAVAFLVLAAPRIGAPFGDSDEGINGAVWGYGSRSLRELGVVDSTFGGRRLDGI